jgi:putative DNA primase/helicase
MTTSAIAFDTLMEPVVARLLGEPNHRLSKPPKDVRYGTHGSLSINLVEGIWFDHEAGNGGGVIDLVMRELRCNREDASEWLEQSGALQRRALSSGPKLVATYDYTDEASEVLFQVVRFEPKDFRQRRPDGSGTWIPSLGETRRVLYRLAELHEAVALEHTVFVVEGEKDVESLRAIGLPATCNPGGASKPGQKPKWLREYSEMLRGGDVVIIGDNDEAGRAHVQAVAASLHGVARRVRVLDLVAAWPECPEKGDVSDWLSKAGGTAEKLHELVEPLDDWQPLRPRSDQPRLRPLTLAEFFSLSIKPREMVLDPIIPEKGLAMLYASRGTGKTHIALGIGYAVATGTKFLKWIAPKPRRVLLIDGEMPAAALQERLANIVKGTEGVEAAPDMLKILAGDLIEEGGIGNLASPAVQAELDPWLDGIDLLVLDNLSSLTAVIRDNDAESWGPIQDWLLRLRRRGVSVLIVHHAGKGGQQRGTSRREDVLDTSISLRRPNDYDPSEGARFEVHLEKARGVHGDSAKPFEAKLEVRGDGAVWTTREIDDLHLARVKAMLDDEMTVRDIADELGVSKSAVHRLKKRIEAEAGGGDNG